jgi:hypothetical protein
MQNIIFLHTNSYKNKFIEFMDFYIAKCYILWRKQIEL